MDIDIQCKKAAGLASYQLVNLEDVFGSVKARSRREDFKQISREARDDHTARSLAKIQRACSECISV